jgi:hypothetical protein
MHAYTHTYIHTYNSYTHTYIHTYNSWNILHSVCMHACKYHMLTYKYIQIHTYIPQILHDVTTDVRPFLTNAADELTFLEFVDKLSAISDALAMYSTYAGVCVCIYIYIYALSSGLCMWLLHTYSHTHIQCAQAFVCSSSFHVSSSRSISRSAWASWPRRLRFKYVYVYMHIYVYVSSGFRLVFLMQIHTLIDMHIYTPHRLPLDMHTQTRMRVQGNGATCAIFL